MVGREELHGGLKIPSQAETFVKASANVRKKQEAVQKRKMLRGDKTSFNVGDKVLLLNIKELQRKGGKMERSSLGPLVILSLKGKLATLASLDAPQKTIANIDLLSPFIEPEERIPAKLKKVGTSPLASPSPPSLPPPPSPPPPSSPDPPPGTISGERQPTQSNGTFSYVTLSIIMLSSLLNDYTVLNFQFLNEYGGVGLQGKLYGPKLGHINCLRLTSRAWPPGRSWRAR